MNQSGAVLASGSEVALAPFFPFSRGISGRRASVKLREPGAQRVRSLRLQGRHWIDPGGAQGGDAAGGEYDQR